MTHHLAPSADPMLDSKYVIVDNNFVLRTAVQTVKAIKEYEPDIDVQYLPVGARKEGQAAYRVVHRPLGQMPYVMFTVRRDEDMTPDVLQKIMVNDQRNNELKMSDLEFHEAAVAAAERQAYLDRMEEANDIAYHVFKTKKNDYKVSKDLRIKDGIPFNVANKAGY